MQCSQQVIASCGQTVDAIFATVIGASACNWNQLLFSDGIAESQHLYTDALDRLGILLERAAGYGARWNNPDVQVPSLLAAISVSTVPDPSGVREAEG